MEIDLPDLSTTEMHKTSHKDFYHKEAIKEVNPEEGDLITESLKTLEPLITKVDKERQKHLKLSDQPFSKWQAIFNLEQLKDRNKPKLAKEELPQAPFFLFDLEKATSGGDGEHSARDFLKETFFTNFESGRKQKGSVGGAALAAKGQSAKLKDVIRKGTGAVQYLKKLSPSGVELEIMSLGIFDFSGDQDENLVSFFLCLTRGVDWDVPRHDPCANQESL